MLILLNPRCADCGRDLNDVIGALVLEWPESPDPDDVPPRIYMRCKNRAICAHNQIRKATNDDHA